MFRRTSILVLLAFLPACALGRSSTNDPLDHQLVAQLQPGVTTAKQVTEILGGPTHVVQLGQRSAYRYDHQVTKSAGVWLLLVLLGTSDTREDRVWVFFDENDVLTHYGSTFESHRTQYALPWEDVHEADENAARDEERGLGGQ